MRSAAIAQSLNVEISQIKSVEVWADVLFVRFVSGSPRFVSKKITEAQMQHKTFSGKWFPGMPKFSNWEDEFDWLEANGLLEDELDVDGAIAQIAKYLPIGSSPSEANLLSKAQKVAEGTLTAQEAANLLSNKKVITLRK